MTIDYKQAQKFFSTAASTPRLRILSELADQELSVMEICFRIGIAQSPVSQHLRCLRDAQLVKWRRDGVHVYYQLTPGISESLLAFVYGNFSVR